MWKKGRLSVRWRFFRVYISFSLDKEQFLKNCSPVVFLWGRLKPNVLPTQGREFTEKEACLYFPFSQSSRDCILHEKTAKFGYKASKRCKTKVGSVWPTNWTRIPTDLYTMWEFPYLGESYVDNGWGKL